VIGGRKAVPGPERRFKSWRTVQLGLGVGLGPELVTVTSLIITMGVSVAFTIAVDPASVVVFCPVTGIGTGDAVKRSHAIIASIAGRRNAIQCK
jgi:hypothetical protein